MTAPLNKMHIWQRITAKGGRITLNMEEATHIFHPSVDGNADLYSRPVVKRGDKCLVHFLQLPGISDTWGVCFSNMEPGVAPEKKR